MVRIQPPYGVRTAAADSGNGISVRCWHCFADDDDEHDDEDEDDDEVEVDDEDEDEDEDEEEQNEERGGRRRSGRRR